jgi:NAD(P)-dependent dehydrogenase (short-subunit alcohol dehydrogenase family)
VHRGDVQGIPLAEMSTQDLVDPVVTGVTANFVTARAAARQMVEQGSGVILALNSGSAHGSPLMGGTGTADAATDTLVRNLAGEIGPHGVRVLGVWVAGIPETLTPEKLTKVNNSIPVDESTIQGLLGHLDSMRITRRSPRLAEAVNTLVFLASDAAAGITGTFVNATSMPLGS